MTPAPRALVRAENAGLPLLRAEIARATRQLVADVALVTAIASRRRTAEQAVALTQRRAEALALSLARVIEALRLAAKKASFDSLTGEWAAVRKGLTKAGHSDPGPLGVQVLLAPTDTAQAASSARSLASTWSRVTLAAVWAWADREDAGDDLGRAIAAANVDGAVKRTVATESAQAFADLRDEGAGWLAEVHRDADWLPAVGKAWDASNDRKICPTCARMGDSLPRPVGVPFPGGAEPGYAHPFCRCVPRWVLLPARVRTLERRGRQVDDFAPRSLLDTPQAA